MAENTTPASQADFPSLRTTFSEAWVLLARNMLNLIGLSVISLIIAIVSTALFIGVMAALPQTRAFVEALVSLPSLSGKTSLTPTDFLAITQSLRNGALAIGSVFLAFMVVVTLGSLMLGAALMLLLGKEGDRPSFLGVLGQGFKFALPLFILGMISTLLEIGGLFVLIIPGILFIFLFMFASADLILERQGVISSLRRSYQIVAQNFGHIFLALMVYFLAYIIMVIFIPNLVLRLDTEAGTLIMILRTLVSFVVGWYGVAFSLVLYKSAKTRTDFSKYNSVVWIALVAILGWIIAILLSIGSLALAKKFIAQKLNAVQQKTEQSASTSAFTMIPSSCGLSLPVPKTADTKDGKNRKWIYEEIGLDSPSFTPLDADIHPRKFTLGAYLGFRDQPFAKDSKTFVTDFPGIMVKCTENPKGYTLDEYVALTKTNKDYLVEEAGNRGSWGEVATAFVTIKGKSKVDKREFEDRAYLAVSQDKHRLIYLTIWGPSDSDPNKDQINKDNDTILHNLKYRDVPETLVEPQREQSTATPKKNTSATTTDCQQFTIREGEFTSDKCYSSKDYGDLSYNIDRFNDAVFRYNGAAGQANVTCNGFTDQFKQMCDQAKQDMDKAKADQDNYRNAIQTIIARGK